MPDPEVQSSTKYNVFDFLATGLSRLALRRPLFHSEADFQHELAWQVRLNHPDARARLEVPFPRSPGKGRGWLDLLVRFACRMTFGLELKYLTGRLDAVVDGERFALSRRAAQDI